MTPRRSEAGVTLIEMLAALAVAALIGVAGFTLLDGVVTRDAQLSGRLGRIGDRDRAFQLLQLDASRAHGATFTTLKGLTLLTAGPALIWRADAGGLTRQITWPDGRSVTQRVLPESAELLVHPATRRAVLLTLPEARIERVFSVANGLAP